MFERFVDDPNVLGVCAVFFDIVSKFDYFSTLGLSGKVSLQANTWRMEDITPNHQTDQHVQKSKPVSHPQNDDLFQVFLINVSQFDVPWFHKNIYEQWKLLLIFSRAGKDNFRWKYDIR